MADNGWDPLNLKSRKLPRPPSMQYANPNQVKSAIIHVLLSHLFIRTFYLYLSYTSFAKDSFTFRGPPPSFLEMTLQIFLGVSVCDVGFYIVHWFFHTRIGYKYYHKKHHEFYASTGFTTEYSSLGETTILFYFTLTIVPLLWPGYHLLSWLSIVGMRTFYAFIAHTGYNVPPLAYFEISHHGPTRPD